MSNAQKIARLDFEARFFAMDFCSSSVFETIILAGENFLIELRVFVAYCLKPFSVGILPADVCG